METGNGNLESSQAPGKAESNALRTPAGNAVGDTDSAFEASPRHAAGGEAFPAMEGQPDRDNLPPAEGQPGTTGGRLSGWFRRHRVLAGVLAGLAAIALLGGMFAAGYAVGKPDRKEPVPTAPGYERPWRKSRPFQPYQRPRENMENIPRRADILRQARDELLELAASELGISPEDLEDRLEDGESIADVAEEKGLPVEDLVKKLSSRICEIADRLVSEGSLTEYQAETVKERSEALASLFVHDGLRAMRGPMRR